MRKLSMKRSRVSREHTANSGAKTWTQGVSLHCYMSCHGYTNPHICIFVLTFVLRPPACSTCLSRRDPGLDSICSQKHYHRVLTGIHQALPLPASTLSSHCYEAAQAALKPHDWQHVCTSLRPHGLPQSLLKLPTSCRPWRPQRYLNLAGQSRNSLLYLCGGCLKIAETNLIKTLDKGALWICAWSCFSFRLTDGQHRSSQALVSPPCRLPRPSPWNVNLCRGPLLA